MLFIYVAPTTRETLRPSLELPPIPALAHLAHSALPPGRGGCIPGSVVGVAYDIVPQRVEAVHDMRQRVCRRPSGVQIDQAFLNRLL